jgi:hypothetical protein
MPAKTKRDKRKQKAKVATQARPAEEGAGEVKISQHTCTGSLASDPNARDLKVISFTLSAYSQELILVGQSVFRGYVA